MKQTNQVFLFLLVGLAAISAPISVHATTVNLIENGGFEGPVITTGGVLSSVAAPTFWAVTDGQGEQLAVSGSYLPAPSEGNQYYYIGDGGLHANIQQSVLLTALQSYRLSFDLTSLWDHPYLGFMAEVDLTITNGVETFLPGLTYDFTVPAGTQSWMTQSFQFTPTSTANYQFIFTAHGAYGGTHDAAFIDRVTLYNVACLEAGDDHGHGEHSVPDSTNTTGLIIFSLGGLAMLRRFLVI